MERYCLVPEHQNQPIMAYCISEHCRKQNRAVCFKCMTDLTHQQHTIIQTNQEENFLQQANINYRDISDKLNALKQQFSTGITYLEMLLEKYYRPMPLSNFGNKEITNKIDCLLKLEKVQKLINDRIDNIFEHTLKSIRITCHDLTQGQEFQGYELLSKQNYQEALKLVDQNQKVDPKSALLRLAKAEIYQNSNRVQEARLIYQEILQTEQFNPWASIELNKLLGQQERR
ncbi:unnamed protein product (macronuclear) [Paramecium tetraurelia]|uniref:Uncharacterized protein n=1 Tax=Paramecium tetraurelia TaxID=5888 RepID=A0BH57_PARTE|nr:uncharacterized protein GSPATT00028909001 [Paramecium tetraurelia]CAK57874.1 unnamed protein product [Paramecium tetraurelia]|eukprot:XP_001425272.1 hypothetical protein (macronuclear) [Paramecium tetraurelia strain d4-2]